MLTFQSPIEFLDHIQDGNDLYNPVREIIVEVYNDSGSIRYAYATLAKAHALALDTETSEETLITEGNLRDYIIDSIQYYEENDLDPNEDDYTAEDFAEDYWDDPNWITVPMLRRADIN